MSNEPQYGDEKVIRRRKVIRRPHNETKPARVEDETSSTFFQYGQRRAVEWASPITSQGVV